MEALSHIFFEANGIPATIWQMNKIVSLTLICVIETNMRHTMTKPRWAFPTTPEGGCLTSYFTPERQATGVPRENPHHQPHWSPVSKWSRDGTMNEWWMMKTTWGSVFWRQWRWLRTQPPITSADMYEYFCSLVTNITKDLRSLKKRWEDNVLPAKINPTKEDDGEALHRHNEAILTSSISLCCHCH